MSGPLRWFGVGLIVLGAAVTGAYVAERARTPAPPPAAAVHALESLPRPGDSTAGIPDLRPDFSLRDAAGRPHPIGEWDGHPLLVNFWATWCAPCRREIPLLNRLQAEPALANLQVVGIAVDIPADVQAFLRRTPIRYPVLIGEQDGLDVASAFGVQALALPFSAFVDGRGRVLSVHLGELHESQARATLSVLARLDRGELSPAAAREALQAALARLLATPPPAGPDSL